MLLPWCWSLVNVRHQAQTRDCCYADTEWVTCRVPPLGHVWHVGWVTSEEYHDVTMIRTQEDDSSLKRIWQQSAWVGFISGIRNSHSRSEGGEECSVLGIPTPRGSLQSIINTSKHAIVHNQSWSTELWTQHRDWIIQMSQCLQFEPQWEFNFHNYQAKLDFHWWAVSESCCQVSGGEHHQAGNSPIWDNSRVKITVQIVSNPYFS